MHLDFTPEQKELRAEIRASLKAVMTPERRVNAAMTKGALGMGEASAVKVFGTELTQQVARELLEVLDGSGTRIVATNSEFEIERYPRLGDVISVTQVFEDISDEKRTSLGTGHFITWLSTYTDQHGEVLGRQRFRVFRFKAGVPADQTAGAS